MGKSKIAMSSTPRRKKWKKFTPAIGSAEYKAYYTQDGKIVSFKLIPIKMPIKFELPLPLKPLKKRNK